VGGYFQNEWKNEQLTLSLGGRIDKHNLMDEIVFVPRANVRYTPVNGIGLRTSYSSGYRAPQTFDEDLHIAAVGGEVALISLAPDLRPEYSNSFNFSVDLYRKFSWIETNLLIDAFYTHIKDAFSIAENGVDDNNNLLLERINASGITVRGVNMDLRLGFTHKFVINSGFTIQRSQYDEPFEWSPDVPAGKRMQRAPDHYGYLTLNYNPVKRLSASVTGTYTGSMLVSHFAGFVEKDEEIMSPSFLEAGVKLSYDFQLTDLLKLQINGGLKNLLGQYQKDIDSGPLRDAGYFYGPAIPRTVYFGVKLMM
jgi:outer membrane receptor for ferrienterochelin and colicins